MTREEANQLYYINKEIKMWERELDKLRKQSDIRSPSNTGMPFVPGISDRTSSRALKYIELEEKIQELKQKAIYQKMVIMQYVSTIPNSVDRQIVFLRAAACLSWKTIAEELGGGNTDASVRMRYNRLFEKICK